MAGGHGSPSGRRTRALLPSYFRTRISSGRQERQKRHGKKGRKARKTEADHLRPRPVEGPQPLWDRLSLPAGRGVVVENVGTVGGLPRDTQPGGSWAPCQTPSARARSPLGTVPDAFRPCPEPVGHRARRLPPVPGARWAPSETPSARARSPLGTVPNAFRACPLACSHAGWYPEDHACRTPLSGSVKAQETRLGVSFRSGVSRAQADPRGVWYRQRRERRKRAAEQTVARDAAALSILHGSRAFCNFDGRPQRVEWAPVNRRPSCGGASEPLDFQAKAE